MDIKHYIFYHDNKLLDKVRPEKIYDFELIDLNEIEIPDYLRFDDLTPFQNRLIYSEYLGILTITPTSEFVGLFTYSIPIKFSKEWAEKTKCYDTFLPEIKFNQLLNKSYDINKLYGVEFSNPICKEVTEIHNSKYRIGKKFSVKSPFKSSIIVSCKEFLYFQKWFKEVTIYLLEKNQTWKFGEYFGSGSPFTQTNSIKKNQRENDKLFRHGISGIQERLMAYYFGQTFKDKDKIKLGNFLNGK